MLKSNSKVQSPTSNVGKGKESFRDFGGWTSYDLGPWTVDARYADGYWIAR